jgi:hypothetical protein
MSSITPACQIQPCPSPMATGEVARRTKLLTFESWVTRATWYDYALAYPEMIPFPLIDRSPCQDPFFDPFAAPQDRRPVISGLCRGRAMRNFRVGDCSPTSPASTRGLCSVSPQALWRARSTSLLLPCG